MWAHIADIEYKPKYDRLLAPVLLAVGLGSVAAIPFVDPGNGPLILRLVLLDLFSLTTALLTYGTLDA